MNNHVNDAEYLQNGDAVDMVIGTKRVNPPLTKDEPSSLSKVYLGVLRIERIQVEPDLAQIALG